MQTLFPTQSDHRLLAEVVARRSNECFAQLVQRHASMVLSVCQRQLGNHHDAEDAAQAVFLVLWKRADVLEHRTSLASWLHRVARNVCQNAKRARQARRLKESMAAQEKDTATMESKSWNDIKEVLDDAVNRLPDKYRLPIVLFYLEGRSQEEIATLLEAKQPTVATWLKRGREMLCLHLSRQGFALGVSALSAMLATDTCSASVPTVFALTTTRAATLFAEGNRAVAGVLSARSTALAEEVLDMVLWTRIKIVAATLLATATLTCASWAYFRQPTPEAKKQEHFVAAPLPLKDRIVAEEARYEIPLKELAAAHNSWTRARGERVKLPTFRLGAKPQTEEHRRGATPRTEEPPPTNILEAKLTPPVADRETVVTLHGPTLNTGETWRPTRVLREGKQITLIVDAWLDNGPRLKNVPFEPTYLVSLGKLAVGEYEFCVRVNHMRLEFGLARPPKHYRLADGLQGKLHLTVAGSAKEAATNPVPVLEKNQLVKWKSPWGIDYQRLDDPWSPVGAPALPIVNYLDARNVNGIPKPQMRVGTCNLERVWKEIPTVIDRAFPSLHQPKLGEPVYVSFLGPQLDFGESLQLRSIRWEGRTVIVSVALWRDGWDRSKNGIHYPVLFVPLREGWDSVLAQPGDYEVEFEWTFFYASGTTGENLYERYTPKTIGESTLAPAFQKSFLALPKWTPKTKFTIAKKEE